MVKKRSKEKTFSAIRAVKANARERIGQPKPARVIVPEPRQEKRDRRHPKTLTGIIHAED
jgi:hypothetical protein